MAVWTSPLTASLQVSGLSTSDKYTFHGVNGNVTEGGSPDNYLSAANNILSIGGLSAVLDDIQLTQKLGAEDNG